MIASYMCLACSASWVDGDPECACEWAPVLRWNARVTRPVEVVAVGDYL